MLFMLTLAHIGFTRQSARGLAQSKTLRVVQASMVSAERLGVRRPSAAFPGNLANRANVDWNCHTIRKCSNYSVQLPTQTLR
jgi:hypothetical protein